ncbi:hypothetical protein [Pedobacter sp.]
MKQEVKVNVTLTIESDAGCNKYEISQFVRALIPGEFEKPMALR